MKRFAIVLSFASLVAGLALLSQPHARAEGACGEKGQPKCPLQGWMEKNMQDPIDAKDLKTVAASFEKLAKMSPDPSWADWAKTATDGATAAKAGDLKGAQAACKSCHKAHRNDYKSKFRMRPVQ